MDDNKDNGQSSNSHKNAGDHGRLKKNVSKMAFRSKEKMLRTLGRVDETKDEIIDNYVHLLNKQQSQAQKFQRELKNYMNSISAMKSASAAFYQAINAIYEDEWNGKETIQGFTQKSDLLYDDLREKMSQAIHTPLHQHSAQCNDIRLKVNKRGRKLVDFDAARRNYHSATQHHNKNRDDLKLNKAKEQVDVCGKTYDGLNGELHNELPQLYDSRLPLYANIVTSISTAENAFYGEMSEIRGRLLATVETLKCEFEDGKYHIQRSPLFSSMKQQVATSNHDDDDVDDVTSATLPCNDRLPPPVMTSATTSSPKQNGNRESNDGNSSHDKSPQIDRDDDDGKRRSKKSSSSNHPQTSDYVNVQLKDQSPDSYDDDVEQKPTSNGDATAVVGEAAEMEKSEVEENKPQEESVEEETSTSQQQEEVEDLPPPPASEQPSPSDESDILPPHYMFTVQAQHPYTGDDDDELTFGKGDVIYVVEFPDPEEQDEGWQMGVLKSSWQSDKTSATSTMGLFPENFTKRI